MFTGFISKKASFDNLEENLNKFSFLGESKILNSKQGAFLKPHTFYKQKTSVRIFINTKNEVFLNFSYSFIPNILSWILGICFFPFGFLIFIIPNKEKDEFEYFLSTHDF